MSSYIPPEIQLIIMKKLPVKSLIRFRSVCKSWKSLIGSSGFITDHNNLLHRSQSHKHHLLVRYRDKEDNEEEYVSIVDDDDDDIFIQQKLSPTDPIRTTIIGTSQGLVCFYDNFKGVKFINSTKTAVIWNPTIRKSVTIDVPNVLDNYPIRTVIGFGVCPHTSDPKLVKIIGRYDLSSDSRFWRNPLSSNLPCQQVEVFSLSSGFWRNPLSSNLPRKSLTFIQSEVVNIDGFIYWLTYERDYDSLIISFDMTTEEFTEIDLPYSITSPYVDLSIYKLKESLVLLEFMQEVNQPFCNVWIMEHGVRKSFTKLYTINTPNPPITIKVVLGFTKSGQPIITMTKDFEHETVCVYEPSSQHITCIGSSEEKYSLSACSYIETLLLLDH